MRLQITVKNLHFLCVIWLTLSFTSKGNAQVNRIDSLKNNIRKTNTTAAKIEAIFALCAAYESLHADTLYQYTQLAKKIAAQLKDPARILESSYYEAVYLFKKNKLDSALELTEALIKKYKQSTPYNDMHVNLYVLKFNAYWRKNNFNEAIATSHELLKVAEEHHDTTGLIKGRMDMGAGFHIVSNQPLEGLKWYYQALALLTSAELKARYSGVFQNIAIAYDDLAKQDSTERYLKLGLQYARLGDNQTNLARALRLYGSIMADYGKIKEAEPAFKEAIEVQKNIGDIFGTVRAMQGEADFYASTNRNAEAITIYKEALGLAEKNGMSLMMLNDINKNLSLSYTAIGDYKGSNEVLKRMLVIKDSNYKLNSAASLAELQTKFDVQKKETLIAQQKLTLWQRNLLLYGGAVTTLLLTLFAAYRFRRYQQKQQQLQEERNRINQQAIKDAEEKERKRIAAELHDNLGVQANAILHNTNQLSSTELNNTAMVADLQETAKEMLHNLRETLWAMKSADVTATDVWLRIINFMKQMGRHYTNIAFNITGTAPQHIPIASSKALHIVLVLQECVNNSVKHAAAQTITVNSSKENSKWEISIVDDGKGFELLDKKLLSDHYGLANMQERSTAGEFKLEIDTAPGRGTKTTIMI